MIIVAASDLSGVTDAVTGALQSGDIYIAPGVKSADALTNALTDVVPADGSIAVVVLPADADLGAAFDLELLDRITREVPQKTVVLALGDDLQAASSAIDAKEALFIANTNETAAGGDTQAALVETVQQIVEATPSAPGGSGRRTPASVTASDPVPAGIRLRVDRLRELQVDYARVPGDAVAAQTAAGIDALASHVEQLFLRLDAKADADQIALAEAEYSDKLARLVAALEPDYLLDLLTRPDLWDAPDERIGEVREALDGLTTQIVDNIKQVNARKGLLFQVSLDSLIGRSELRDWERQFNQGSKE
nr:hypothetical protein [Microbacterium barkeri]